MTKLFEDGEARPPFVSGLDLGRGFYNDLHLRFATATWRRCIIH